MPKQLEQSTKWPGIRFLRLGSIALALVLVFAAFFYRDDLFQSYLDPGMPFQTYQPPAPPNYANETDWLSWPETDKDPVDIIGQADIFVITPTLFLGGQEWVASVKDAEFEKNMRRVVMPNYVAPYSAGGRLYAPNYRQASLYSFLTNRDDARRAQEFAYQDVKTAFDFFLAEHLPERPIILVGHGQGALHLQRLLAEYFNGPQNEDRVKALAAAYIIDHPTPRDLFTGPLASTPLCSTEDQTHCVVAFGAFMPNEGLTARQFVSNTLVFEGARLTSTEGRPIACVNPLLWTDSTDYAPARLHKGGVAAEGLAPGDEPAPFPRQTGAQCQDGLLLIDKPKQRSLRRPLKFGGRYRTLPSNLFYEDLRSNMITRISALIEENILPRRAPPLDETEQIEIIDSPVTLPPEE